MRQHSVPPNALLDYAHNIYLDVLASSGLLGLGAFAWLLFSLLRALWRRLATPDPLQSSVVVGACAALAAFLVHGLFDSVHHSAPTGLWTLAILLSAALMDQQRVILPRLRFSRVTALGFTFTHPPRLCSLSHSLG
jgi:O-antigen ligase